MSKRAFAAMSIGSNNTMTDNKRIAKNTVIVYIRLVVVTLIGLLSSRFVLQALGVSDYGLYNVVGSIIGMFAFISGSLSVTTIRFLNFEKGKPDGDMNRMFNICNALHIGMAALLLILFEIFGVWYIINYLNVEPGKEADAMFVFQVSIVVCCLGIMNVPYSSLYNVHEKFVFPTVITIIDAVLKLASILALLYYPGNRLRVYAFAMSVITFSDFVVYHLMAYRNWRPIVRWSFVPKWGSYREVISYTNYNMLSTVSMTARSQGSNLLINFFFGTVVNAAYAVSTIVRSFVEMFMSSFDGAAAPQITQNISANNTERVAYLAHTICRACIILTELVLLPLYLEMDFILKLWLGNPPEGTTLFCRITLFIVLMAATCGGIGRVIDGAGKIKWFKIQISFYYLLCLPVGYVLFHYGFPAYWILILFVLSDVFNRITQLILLKVILNFDIATFVKEAYTRPFVIFVLMAIFAIVYQHLNIQAIPMRMMGIIISVVFSAIIVYAIGLKKDEKQKVLQLIKNKMNHNS